MGLFRGGDPVRILIDADACPVARIAEETARRHGIPAVMLCDGSHRLTAEYAQVRVVDQGPDAADLALINLCQRGDIVVTQDYGVAALALGKGALALHQSGRAFTDDNIGGLLMDRHLAKKARRAGQRLKGPSPRTREEDRRFAEALERMIREEEDRCSG